MFVKLNGTPRIPSRSSEAVRRELGVGAGEFLVLHSSNLRPVKRVDVLLEAFARAQKFGPSKLLVLAGANFSPFMAEVQRLGLGDRVLVRENVSAVEDYLQVADLGLFTSESESFCLSILEAMSFGCPSVSTRVGGIPEVMVEGETGLLVPMGDMDGLAQAIGELRNYPARRLAMGVKAKQRAQTAFSAEAIVEHYIRFYRSVCLSGSLQDGAGM